MADLRPMVDALRRDPLLLRLTTVSALLYLSTGLIGGVATLYKVDALRLTPGQLGLIQALGSVGVAAGAVAARALSARWSGPRIMAAACAVFALGGAALPAARGQGFELVALLAAGAALQDAAGTVFGVHQRAMMQSRVELAVLGRVSAAFAFVAAAATLLGFLMSGLFGTWGGVLLPLWAGVAGSLAAAVAFEVRPFAPRRPVRRTLEGE
ncbi:MAG: hypothetical protein IMW98_06870 [Firmicutes bacterium]|nr:hypothetical protein [Bacillota bacterium]